jgi:TetR/AcrR family transcriptional repressor of nem operon
MELFWEKGYEATSIQDLVDNMEINRFSLYDTFGSKHQLFLEALDRYSDEIVTEALCEMEGPEVGLDAIRKYFDHAIAFGASENGRLGCLMTNSAVELGPHDVIAAEKVDAHMKRLEAAFLRQLRTARANGELETDRNLRDLAQFLAGASQGLVVLSKGSEGRRALQRYVNTLLSVLN